jgi:predicted HTH domain antitoxin
MSVQPSLTPIQFTLQLSDIPDAIHQEAESKAKEAYIMTLLRHGIISSGRAARLLDIPRLDVIELMGEYGISVFAPQTQAELEQEVAETRSMLEPNKA